MAWFLLARALFVVAVTYAAVLARPFSSSALRQSPCWRRPRRSDRVGRDAAAGRRSHRSARRADRRRSRARAREDDRCGAVLGRHRHRRVVFLHSIILLVFPYLGILMGARKGEWLEPGRGW